VVARVNFTDDQVKNMPGPGPLSAASGVRTSGDGDGRKLRIRQGDSRRQRTPPRYAEAGTGTYDIITRYRLCITYRSGVNGVCDVTMCCELDVALIVGASPVALKMKKIKAFQPSLSLRAASDVIVTSVQPNGNAIPPDVDPLRAVAARRTANHNSFDRCQ